MVTCGNGKGMVMVIVTVGNEGSKVMGMMTVENGGKHGDGGSELC